MAPSPSPSPTPSRSSSAAPSRRQRRKAKSKNIPPPESAQSIRTRGLVLFSFWFVVVCLGVPLWIATTSTYRAQLPLKDMARWANGEGCKAEFSLLVDVEAKGLADAEGVLKAAQGILDDGTAAEGRSHHLRLRLVGNEEKQTKKEKKKDVKGGESSEENVACVLKLLPGDEGFKYSVESTSRVVELRYPTTNNADATQNLAGYVASTLQDIFWQERQVIEHLLQTYNKDQQPEEKKTETNDDGKAVHVPKRMSEAEMARRMSRVVSYAPRYHLAFSLFTATSSPQSWDVEEALGTYLSPLLAALSGVSNFTVSSQVQYYASMTPSVVPTWDEATKSWALKKEDLSSFINSAEWPLASISDLPTINFILYVPHPSVTPLKIPTVAASATANNEGFLIPQWGGVVILNPTTDSAAANQHLPSSVLRSPLETFAAQLLALLGAPAHPASLPIRLDSLTRQRSAEVLVSASSTLGSLLAIVSSLSSIAIPQTVQNSVKATLEHLSYGCEELTKGHFRKSLQMGRVAQEEAEKAFFERTMVAQVYFPDEHKVAVYLPLLGPVGVPLLMALWREASRIIASRRAARRPVVAK